MTVDPDHPSTKFSGYAVPLDEADLLRRSRAGKKPVEGEVRSILSPAHPTDPKGFRLAFPSIFFFGRWYRLDTEGALLAKQVNDRFSILERSISEVTAALRKLQDAHVDYYARFRSVDKYIISMEASFAEKIRDLEASLKRRIDNRRFPRTAKPSLRDIPENVDGGRRTVRGPKGKLYPSVREAAKAHGVSSSTIVRRIRTGHPDWTYGDGGRVPIWALDAPERANSRYSYDGRAVVV